MYRYPIRCTVEITLLRNHFVGLFSFSFIFTQCEGTLSRIAFVFVFSRCERMHSSRMRTVRCSSCLWGGGVSARHPRGQNDRRLWKHYLAATLRTVINLLVNVTLQRQDVSGSFWHDLFPSLGYAVSLSFWNVSVMHFDNDDIPRVIDCRLLRLAMWGSHSNSVIDKMMEGCIVTSNVQN